jgi:hypothetical protein
VWFSNRKSILACIVFTALATSTPLHAGKSRLLNRSIYVPVQFRLCEHLTSGVLYIREQAVAHLPAERVFQFTYYPSLHRIAPDSVDVRIDAIDQEGHPITARLAVTPSGIWTAHEHIDFDFNKHLKKLSYKIDTRYDKVDLLIRCGHWCGRVSSETAPGTEEAETETPSPEQPAVEGKREGEK